MSAPFLYDISCGFASQKKPEDKTGAGPPIFSSKRSPQPEPCGALQFIEFRGSEIWKNGIIHYTLKMGPNKKLMEERTCVCHDCYLSKLCPQKLSGGIS